MREKRRRAAEMGELEADPGIALERAGVDELGDRPHRLERELVEPHRVVGQRGRVRRQRRVHEDIGAAPVELGEHRIPCRVAEVRAAHVRQQHHAVEREPVERVADLLERAVDIGQREQREAGEAVGRAAHDVGDPLVRDPRELPGPGRVTEERAGRAGGDHGRIDLVALHHGLEALERRRQHRHAAERLDVGRRQHVCVGVDAGHPSAPTAGPSRPS